MRIGVLISGSGTNLQAIMDASTQGLLEADVAVVVSNRQDAYGAERARKAGVPAVWIDRTEYTTFRAYNEAIRDVLVAYEVDIVAMAGYMRLLGKEVLDAFPHRVVNIHPSLLPSFPGPSAIREAFEYGVKVTGVTVHIASERFDEGPIIAQGVVEVAEDETLESLEAKIHEVEHRIYPAALQLMVAGCVTISGRRALISPAP
ncbi:MAG: phosphoribosylglycinamide formyltransferase [Coriobacteriia bacterium]|jgi:phosphoribosylglycinamide formyltransferase-1|nr:phosphoribosylglycinamide formyltransferase [Coriobacteriia bacterium]